MFGIISFVCSILFVCQVSYGEQPVKKAEPKPVTAEELRRSLGDDFVCFVTDSRSDYVKYTGISNRNPIEDHTIYGSDGKWAHALFTTLGSFSVSGFEIPRSDDRFVDLTEICASHAGEELRNEVYSVCKFFPNDTYLIDLAEMTDSTVVVRYVIMMHIYDDRSWRPTR